MNSWDNSLIKPYKTQNKNMYNSSKTVHNNKL